MSDITRINQLTIEAMVSNLTSLTKEEKYNLIDGLNKLSVKKIIDLSQYLKNIILPQVHKNKGPQSTEYKNFKGISDALIWALHVMSLQDSTLYNLSNEKLLTDFYRKKCLFYEKQLMQYTTMDNLLMLETFDDLKKSMIKNEAGC